MKRHSKAGGEPVKPRRRKATSPKRRNGPKVVGRRSATAASLDKEVARLTRELNEALRQQTASPEVLRRAVTGGIAARFLRAVIADFESAM